MAKRTAKRTGKRSAKKTARRPPAERATLRRELEVHREELAAQNEELRALVAEVTAAKERTALLYDVAPVGYVTLDERRRVVEANLMAGELVGVARDRMFGRTFDDFVAPNERVAFRKVVGRALGGSARASCAIGLGSDGAVVPVHLEAAKLPARSANAQVLVCVSTVDTGVRGGDAHADKLRELAEAIRVVLTCSELALRDLAPESPAGSALLEVRDAASRAATITRGMLDGGRCAH
jgi:PAS domain S-box-containing protein